jgi:hypothetical protein
MKVINRYDIREVNEFKKTGESVSINQIYLISSLSYFFASSHSAVKKRDKKSESLSTRKKNCVMINVFVMLFVYF